VRTQVAVACFRRDAVTLRLATHGDGDVRGDVPQLGQRRQ